jgi:hypothetical protein
MCERDSTDDILRGNDMRHNDTYPIALPTLRQSA